MLPLSPGTWLAGAVIIKRAHTPTPWLEWEDRFCRQVVDEGFRLQRLRRAADGRIAVDGWIARDHLPGEHRPGAWGDTIDAGIALNRALLRAAKDPPILPPARTDAWATADAMAWAELPIPPAAMADPTIAELAGSRRPVRAPAQVVHGDLTGNVLFHRELPPAIIDFSPYHRPAAYALGVIVADAIVWHDADLPLTGRILKLPDGPQCLLRAMLFRHLTALILPGALPMGTGARRYAELRRITRDAVG